RHEDVDATAEPAHGRDEPVEVRERRGVAPHGRRPRPEDGERPLELGRGPARDHDVGPLRHEALGDRQPDALRGAGDDGEAPGQRPAHLSAPAARPRSKYFCRLRYAMIAGTAVMTAAASTPVWSFVYWLMKN